MHLSKMSFRQMKSKTRYYSFSISSIYSKSELRFRAICMNTLEKYGEVGAEGWEKELKKHRDSLPLPPGGPG